MQPHRRVFLLRKALAPSEQGPLRYSGFDVQHPALQAAPEQKRMAYLIAFWFWAPEHQRHTWDGKSAVSDVRPAESLLLATGELEEVRRNFVFPADMPLPEVTRHLVALWERQCVERLGYLPEWCRAAQAASVSGPVRQLEQERGRIEIVTR